jgi:hypothetical protein
LSGSTLTKTVLSARRKLKNCQPASVADAADRVVADDRVKADVQAAKADDQRDQKVARVGDRRDLKAAKAVATDLVVRAATMPESDSK